MSQQSVDSATVEAFGDKLVGMLNNGMLALMTSIGHRTGLFDTMSTMSSATSEEVARAAGLNERYVREWLGAMATGGIVECDPEGPKYQLPAEHAALLTRAAGADNIGVFTQYVAVLGSVEDQIVECFKNGGGVPYSEYKRFHEVMAEDSGQSVLSSLIAHILPLADGITARLESGIDVLDLGCGSGKALNLMAQAFPKSRFVGYDLSEEAINRARGESNGYGNITFEIRDVTRLGETARYDLITAFDAIHDQKDPAEVLRGIHTALRDDGTFLMQDIDGSSHVHRNMEHPIGPALYTISCMHCMTVSLAQGGVGLGAMWGTELASQMLEEAGFKNVTISRLKHDFQNAYYIARKA